jgi:hypothetical protein
VSESVEIEARSEALACLVDRTRKILKILTRSNLDLLHCYLDFSIKIVRFIMNNETKFASCNPKFNPKFFLYLYQSYLISNNFYHRFWPFARVKSRNARLHLTLVEIQNRIRGEYLFGYFEIYQVYLDHYIRFF